MCGNNSIYKLAPQCETCTATQKCKFKSTVTETYALKCYCVVYGSLTYAQAACLPNSNTDLTSHQLIQAQKNTTSFIGCYLKQE